MVLCCGKSSVLMREGHRGVAVFAGLINSHSASKWVALYSMATCREVAEDVMQMSLCCLVPQGHVWLRMSSHQEAFTALWVESNAHRLQGLYANLYTVLRLYWITAYEATRSKKKGKRTRGTLCVNKSDYFFPSVNSRVEKWAAQEPWFIERDFVIVLFCCLGPRRRPEVSVSVARTAGIVVCEWYRCCVCGRLSNPSGSSGVHCPMWQVIVPVVLYK